MWAFISFLRCFTNPVACYSLFAHVMDFFNCKFRTILWTIRGIIASERLSSIVRVLVGFVVHSTMYSVLIDALCVGCLLVFWLLAYLAMHTHCYDNVVVRFKHFFHSVVGEVEVLFSYVWFKNFSMWWMGWGIVSDNEVDGTRHRPLGWRTALVVWLLRSRIGGIVMNDECCF